MLVEAANVYDENEHALQLRAMHAVNDGMRDSGEEFGSECKGCYVITVSSKQKPIVVDNMRNAITDPLEVYSGCYVRASLSMYPFNTNGNRGIACGLQNVQKWCDGEPLNGRVRAEDEFDALDDVDGDDFLD